MLRSLLSAQGVNPQMITVFIDGYYEVRAFSEVAVARFLVLQLGVCGAGPVSSGWQAVSLFTLPPAVGHTAPHTLLHSQLSQAMSVDKAALAFSKAQDWHLCQR